MNLMHLARTDLNLLVVFEAVARYRSVTSAAEHLALSQPAVSHALKRLRHLLEDALFVRGRNGLVLTPRAEYLLPQIQQILTAIDGLLMQAKFDPLTSTRCFSLAATDYSIATLIPKIVSALSIQAPQASLAIEHYTTQTLNQLEKGELDYSFLGIEPPASPFQAQALFQEHLLGLISIQHPLALKAKRQALTLEDYVHYRHILVSFKDPQPSVIDSGLAKWGLKRTIAVSSPNMVANIASLKDSELIMTVPARLAQQVIGTELMTFELPLMLQPYTYYLLWHKRVNNDAALTWFRQLIVEQGQQACL